MMQFWESMRLRRVEGQKHRPISVGQQVHCRNFHCGALMCGIWNANFYRSRKNFGIIAIEKFRFFSDLKEKFRSHRHNRFCLAATNWAKPSINRLCLAATDWAKPSLNRFCQWRGHGRQRRDNLRHERDHQIRKYSCVPKLLVHRRKNRADFKHFSKKCFFN